TDDRFGLKPVVKRFQVFYVPTFVNYGGSKYGLRLHIIPMLVLYNPFDTKIKGDTYYAIRVYAHFRHCVGAFRFAIGYNVGNYFQCLRDLRTEMMPSLATEVTRPTPDIIRQQQFLVPFRLGANWYSSKYFQSSEKCFDNDEEYPSRWWMSRYTRFYRGYGKPGQNANTISAYPLGYGMKINPSTTDIKNAIAPSNIARPSTNQWLHWKGIVAEGNIVPTETVAATQAGTEKYAARVARIPLYLNNIVYAVTHGKYTNSINRSSGNDNYLLFLSQRSIDARNPDKAPQTNGCDDANLVFLAYDAKGIEPGKAKIFSMRRIVSYVGDPLNASTKNDDGPNGVVEKTDTTSLYETKNAMLHGLDDGGVLGGCFYVDIPHPESEHAAKYANDNDWRYGSDYGKYIMFDLSEIARFQCFAFNGSRMNPSINDLYIDMSDVQGMYPRIEMTSNGENKRAIGGQFNMTPLGYGISTYNVDYSRHNQCDGSLKTDARHWSANHMHNIEYIRLNLDVWIWKREGFKFARYSNNNVNGADYNYSTPIMGPTIAHMVGSRFFLFQEPSFPDPYSAPAFNAKTSNVTFVKDY
ncbi:MAG: hypothetical protein IJI37_04645, partial [Opitutales bacterium]|nr:hypothetical protein [Opitutales bacterium]